MADESTHSQIEKKRKRSFKPKGIISKRKSSKSDLSRDQDDPSVDEGSKIPIRNNDLASSSKMSRPTRSNEKLEDIVADVGKSDNTKRVLQPHDTISRPHKSADHEKESRPIRDNRPHQDEEVKPTSSMTYKRQRPETEPGSSNTQEKLPNERSSKNVVEDENPTKRPSKNIEKKSDPNVKSSTKDELAAAANARLVSIKKIEEANIDVTGEKARLVGVRRLDTPEPRRKHERSDGSDDSSEVADPADAPDVFLPKRYILAIMMFLGFVNMYAIRVNLNVAIGAMVNNHTVVKNGQSVTMPPEFDWSSRLQGVVLGSFYYGYMVLQIPGGYFAMKYSGTKIFGGAVAVAAVLTLLTPLATRYSVWALVFLRVLEGLALGVMLPCNHQIWSLWAPLQERTTLVTIAIAGMNVGTVVTMPLTGLLTKYGFDGGWASVFYCFGLFGVIWYLLWILVVHATPNSHPSISKKERNYINRNVVTRKSKDVPWKAIFTSRPVWAVIVGNLASDWGLYTILICLPLFLMDIMKFNVQTMGFIASLPFLLKALVGPIGGVIADVLRYKYTTTANVRRIFYTIGAMSAAVLILVAGYSTTPTMVVLSMCIGVALSGLLHSGYEVNILDIAPGLSGIVMGVSNTAGTTTGFLSPLLVGVMTENKQRSEWITVFWITFFIYLIGSILFCLMCSGEAQHWAVDTDEDENLEYARDTVP